MNIATYVPASDACNARAMKWLNSNVFVCFVYG